MASTQTVWGIDLGRSALKAIKLRAAGEGKVEVVAHDYVEHARVLSQPDADRPALIAAALEKFLSRNDISKDQVVVSVPGQHTLARFTKLPPIAPRKIPDLVRYEADQQIPFDMDEVIWDYQIFQSEGMPDIEVGIFAMKRELLREHLLHFEQAGIEPTGVQCGPLAIYNAAAFDGLVGDETTILVDIGSESTDLVICTANSLWTRTINIGGNSLTEAVAKFFKRPFAKAEQLKRTAAASQYARQIFQAMRPVFADLVQELQRSIGFYSSTHRDAKVERVIAVGNAMQLPGLQKYLQQNLTLPVDKPEVFRNVVSPAPAGSSLADQHLAYWVAYGLAVQGLELSRVTSNLLPLEIAKQVVWRKKRPAFAAAAACLVLAGGMIWLRYSSDMQAVAASSQGWENVDVGKDDAASIIENGPSGTLSDRAQAIAVQEAGGILKKQLGEIANQGKTEEDETAQIGTLLLAKRKVPAIVKAIHDSVPAPVGPFDGADTPEKIAAAAAAVPRAERREVRIESLNMQFVPDVNDPVWAKSLVDVPPRVSRDDEYVPGFKIELVCSTPNAGGLKFIDTAFLAALRTNGRKPGTGFFIDRAWVIEGQKGGGKVGRTPGRGSSTESETGSTGNLDPITAESVDNDWQFKLWIDVVMRDFPTDEPSAEAEGGGSGAEGDGG